MQGRGKNAKGKVRERRERKRERDRETKREGGRERNGEKSLKACRERERSFFTLSFCSS